MRLGLRLLGCCCLDWILRPAQNLFVGSWRRCLRAQVRMLLRMVQGRSMTRFEQLRLKQILMRSLPGLDFDSDSDLAFPSGFDPGLVRLIRWS